MFDRRTNRTAIERLGSIGFDWFLVRFRSIDYAGSCWASERAGTRNVFNTFPSSDVSNDETKNADWKSLESNKKQIKRIETK